MKNVKPVSGITQRRTVSGFLSSINPAEMHPQSSRKSARRWICAECGCDTGADAVVAGTAILKDNIVICRNCETRRSGRTRQARRTEIFKIAAGVVMTATIAAVLYHHFKSPSTDRATEAARIKRSFENFLSKDNFAAAVGESKRASRMDGNAPSSLENDLNDQMSGWLASRFGALSREEREAVVQLLGAYPDTSSSGGLRLKAVHLDGGHLQVQYAGRANSISNRENARCMLINIFNLLPGVTSIELNWISEGCDASAETFNAQRDQRERLMLDSPSRPMEADSTDATP
jgi:hypothetical protein